MLGSRLEIRRLPLGMGLLLFNELVEVLRLQQLYSQANLLHKALVIVVLILHWYADVVILDFLVGGISFHGREA
jgi:hypothetical protein